MEFPKQFQMYVERVNEALRRFLKTQPFDENIFLTQAMHYGALLGGKRLRPFLVYATGEMFGVTLSTLDVPAAAVEYIHAYSLMHDDLPVMDNNDLRRGLPACHIKFGEASAILAGDALQTLAFSILSDAPMDKVSNIDRLAMISELAAATGVAGMCGGQALDLLTEEYKVNLEQLERIYRYKTGSLIRSSVRLGAFSAGKRSRWTIPILDQYSESIGLAFQIQDDILDMMKDTETLHKRQGTDYKLGKITYPALFGLDYAQRKARHLIHEAQQVLKQLTLQSLDTLALESLADYIIQRDH